MSPDPTPRPFRRLGAACRAPALALAFALAAAAMARADSAVPASPDEVVQAAVLPGYDTPRGTRMAGLRLTLADGWHTYWRAPGDTGIPPSFDWSGSVNVARIALHWPRPRVFTLSGEKTVGYEHLLVLPIEVTPKVPGQPVDLRARVAIGVCKDICLPAELHLSARLDGTGARDPAITAALAEVPEDGRAAGLKGFRCALRPIKDGMHLTAHIALPDAPGPETALIETGDPQIWVGANSTRTEGGRITAEADLVPPAGAPFVLDRSAVRITLLSPDRAVELKGCPGS